MHLASGLSVGLAGIAAGYTIGIVGDAVRRATQKRPMSRYLTANAGSTRLHAAVSGLRWHDSHSDFR